MGHISHKQSCLVTRNIPTLLGFHRKRLPEGEFLMQARKRFCSPFSLTIIAGICPRHYRRTYIVTEEILELLVVNIKDF